SPRVAQIADRAAPHVRHSLFPQAAGLVRVRRRTSHPHQASSRRRPGRMAGGAARAGDAAYLRPGAPPRCTAYTVLVANQAVATTDDAPKIIPFGKYRGQR